MGLGSAYDVEINLEAKDNASSKFEALSSKIESIDHAAGEMGGKLSSMIGSIAGAFTNAAEAAGAFSLKIAALGVGGLMAGVGYGVAHVNAELEKTQISLAAIFNANHVSNGMTQGMQMSADVMSKMRKDAAELPGEFQDLVGIFRAASVPGLRAGMSVDQIRQLSASTMAAGAAAGMQMDVVAREMGMLIAGRAGGHNVLGANLWGLSGERAEKFNKLSDDKRVEFLQKNLSGFGEAAEVFGKSWEGVTSTLTDNFKSVMGSATHWVFDDIKTALGRVNSWFDANRERVLQWAEGIGTQLHNAFQWGLSMFEKYWPTIQNLGSFIQDKIVTLWEKAQPIIESIAERIGTMLKDPGALWDKILTVGKMFLAVKGAGALWGLASGAGGAIGGGVGALGDIAGSGKGGGAGGLAGGAGGELGGILELAGKAQGIIGSLTSMSIFVGLVATLGPAFASLIDETSRWHDDAVRSVKNIGTQLGLMWDSLSRIFGSGGGILDLIENFGSKFLGAIEWWVSSLTSVVQGIESVMNAIASVRDAFVNFGETMRNDPLWGKFYRKIVGDRLGADPNDELPRAGFELGPSSAGLYALQAIENNTKKTAHEPKGKGVHVDKVEITVSANDDPSRVARQIEAHLANIARHPRASRFVVNFSGNE